MGDGIFFFFFFQRCLRLDGFFFLPRRTGDRLVLKWWMIALRNCRLSSVSVVRLGVGKGDAEEQRGAERHLGKRRPVFLGRVFGIH